MRPNRSPAAARSSGVPSYTRPSIHGYTTHTPPCTGDGPAIGVTTGIPAATSPRHQAAIAPPVRVAVRFTTAGRPFDSTGNTGAHRWQERAVVGRTSKCANTSWKASTG